MISQPATPEASGTPMDLTGKIVRSDHHGEWFTAHIHGLAPSSAGYVGTVVDPGNWGRADGDPLTTGDYLAYLPPDFLTVIDSEPDTDDPECE